MRETYERAQPCLHGFDEQQAARVRCGSLRLFCAESARQRGFLPSDFDFLSAWRVVASVHF